MLVLYKCSFSISLEKVAIGISLSLGFLFQQGRGYRKLASGLKS